MLLGLGLWWVCCGLLTTLVCLLRVVILFVGCVVFDLSCLWLDELSGFMLVWFDFIGSCALIVCFGCLF